MPTPDNSLISTLHALQRSLEQASAEIGRREPTDYRPARDYPADLILKIAKADGLRAQIASLSRAIALGAGE
jgi:hypothetical protein